MGRVAHTPFLHLRSAPQHLQNLLTGALIQHHITTLGRPDLSAALLGGAKSWGSQTKGCVTAFCRPACQQCAATKLKILLPWRRKSSMPIRGQHCNNGRENREVDRTLCMRGGRAWRAGLDVLQQLLDEPLYFNELAHNWVEVQSSCQACCMANVDRAPLCRAKACIGHTRGAF